MTDWGTLVDLENCTVNPRAFSDDKVYQDEQERVFGHSWLYVGHETQIPKNGDFLTSYMGEEPVIVCRDEDGQVRVHVNSCRHRGARVCRVDHGNTRMFLCPYHNWSYDLKGRLIGVPQHEESYHGELNRDEWGLLEAPRVTSYMGMIFASFDKEVEDLDVYLGDFKWYLDLLVNRTKGGWEALPGTHKWELGGNWKLAAEQFGGDNYHASAAHQSMSRLGLVPTGKISGEEPWERDFEVATEGGHAWINLAIPDPPQILEVTDPHMARVRAESEQLLTADQQKLVGCAYVGTIFPNFSLISFVGFLSFRLWLPRGPNRIEVWSWGFVERDAAPEVKALARDMQIRTFSTSGIFEQDDGEMWGDCVDSMGGNYRKNFPLNYQMGNGHGRRDPHKPGLIHPPSTEIGVFGFYKRWRTLMGEGGAGKP